MRWEYLMFLPVCSKSIAVLALLFPEFILTASKSSQVLVYQWRSPIRTYIALIISLFVLHNC